MRRPHWILPAVLPALVATGCSGGGSDEVTRTGDPATSSSTAAAEAGGTSGEVEGPDWVLDPVDSSIDVPDGTAIEEEVAGHRLDRSIATLSGRRRRRDPLWRKYLSESGRYFLQ